MRERGFVEEIGYSSYHAFDGQHAKVDGLNVEVGGKFVEGIGDYFDVDRLYAPDPLGRLDGQGRRASDTVTLMGSNGLYIGSDSRP